MCEKKSKRRMEKDVADTHKAIGQAIDSRSWAAAYNLAGLIRVELERMGAVE